MSLIMVTLRPAVSSALTAESLPDPGPLTYTSTVLRPCSMAAFAATVAASAAANGVLLREPLNPFDPALDQLSAFPSTVHVGQCDQRIVEGGLDMSLATFNVLTFSFLFTYCLLNSCHNLYLLPLISSFRRGASVPCGSLRSSSSSDPLQGVLFCV